MRPRRDQAALWERERDGERGANGDAEWLAGVGMHPRWQIDREDRPSRHVGCADEVGYGIARWSGDAVAQQTVDEEVGVLRGGVKPHAELREDVVLPARERPQPFRRAGEHTADRRAPPKQMTERSERVTAVVPTPYQCHDLLASDSAEE